MAARTLTPELRRELREFLEEHKRCDLVAAYLFYLSKRFKVHPVLYPPGKMIFRSIEDAVKQLEAQDKLWRETQIRISYQKRTVNELTKKIYICPFSGKAFGDNTCSNALDAIYDHVSKCPENNEYSGGLKVKRFFVSEDPDVIKNYITERKQAVTKTAYTSVASGKLFGTKEAVIEDFKNHYVKEIDLVEVQNQNRFEIESSFLEFIQTYLNEEKITEFVEELAEEKEFLPYLSQWVEAEDEE